MACKSRYSRISLVSLFFVGEKDLLKVGQWEEGPGEGWRGPRRLHPADLLFFPRLGLQGPS